LGWLFGGLFEAAFLVSFFMASPFSLLFYVYKYNINFVN
jgi:hypothetical protein